MLCFFPDQFFKNDLTILWNLKYLIHLHWTFPLGFIYFLFLTETFIFNFIFRRKLFLSDTSVMDKY